MIVIGLVGYAGAGKSTAANYLSRKYGFHQYSLAAPIKALLNERFGWTPGMWEDRGWKESPQVCGLDSSGDGWERTEPYLSPRQLAQWLGTDVGREMLGETVWTDVLRGTLCVGMPARAIIPDMRFPNEAKELSKRPPEYPPGLGYEFHSVYVYCPTVGLPSTHASETSVRQDWTDHFVRNDMGRLGDFHAELDTLMAQLKIERVQ